MKRRILHTYKILAVAIAAGSVGCAPSLPASSGPAPEPILSESPAPEPPAASPSTNANANANTGSFNAASYNVTAPPATTAAAIAAGAITAAPIAAVAIPAPSHENDALLVALRNELAGHKEAPAGAQRAHFLPLCDKEGFPLVGNMVFKGGPRYQPGQFCAVVRDKTAKVGAAEPH